MSLGAAGIGRSCRRVHPCAAGALLFFVVLPLPASARAQPTSRLCFAGEVTVVGTSGDDVLSAGAGDVVLGGKGDDVITARGSGEHKLCGGKGNDRIEGEGEISGGPGDDHLTGTGKLLGGRGRDAIGNFAHVPKNQYREESSGELRGGPGDDRIRGTDALYGGPGDDRLVGSEYEDRFSPGAGDDLVRGIRNDWDPSEETGPPHDTLDFRRAPRAIHLDGQKGIALGWGRDRFSGLHHVRGSRFGDRLFGSDSGFHPREQHGYGSGPGHDSYEGWLGNDLIVGRAGEDYLRGGKGDDRVRGGTNYDDMFGDGGDDRVTGRRGSDRIFGGAGDDVYDGGHGRDLVSWLESETAVRGIHADLGSGLVTGDGTDIVMSIERLAGTDRSDVLIGGQGDDFLHGYAGIDRVHGREGNDYLDVGYGPDGDLLDGGIGTDTVDLAEWFDRIFVDLERGVLLQHVGRGPKVGYRSWPMAPLPPGFHPARKEMRLRAVEAVIGTDSNDYLFGDAGANILIGGEGRDHLAGRGGDDYLVGGGYHDEIFGGGARDVLIGDCRRLAYASRVYYDYECSPDSDDLFGGAGDDVILGDCGLAKRARRCGEEEWDHLDGGADLDVYMRCARKRLAGDGPKSKRTRDEIVAIEERIPCTWRDFIGARPPRPEDG